MACINPTAYTYKGSSAPLQHTSNGEGGYLRDFLPLRHFGSHLILSCWDPQLPNPFAAKPLLSNSYVYTKLIPVIFTAAHPLLNYEIKGRCPAQNLKARMLEFLPLIMELWKGNEILKTRKFKS